MTASTYPSLDQRLSGGDVTVILAGMEWDAREDMGMPILPGSKEAVTLVSAVRGVTHVKCEHSGGRAMIVVDVHEDSAEAMTCHGALVDQARALATMVEAKIMMTDIASMLGNEPDSDGGPYSI